MSADDQETLASLLTRDSYLSTQFQRMSLETAREDPEDVDWEVMYDALRNMILRFLHTKFLSVEEKLGWWLWAEASLLSVTAGRQAQALRRRYKVELRLKQVLSKIIMADKTEIAWNEAWREVKEARNFLTGNHVGSASLKAVGLDLLKTLATELRTRQSRQDQDRAQDSFVLDQIREALSAKPTPARSKRGKVPIDFLDSTVSLSRIARVLQETFAELKKALEVNSQSLRRSWKTLSVSKHVITPIERREFSKWFQQLHNQDQAMWKSFLDNWRLFHEMQLKVFRVESPSKTQRLEIRLDHLMANLAYWHAQLLRCKAKHEWFENAKARQRIAGQLKECERHMNRLRLEINDAQKLLATARVHTK